MQRKIKTLMSLLAFFALGLSSCDNPSTTSTDPSSEEPVTSEPDTSEPDASDPGSDDEPSTSEPDDPGTSEPDDPGTSEPDDPGTSEPDPSDPGTSGDLVVATNPNQVSVGYLNTVSEENAYKYFYQVTGVLNVTNSNYGNGYLYDKDNPSNSIFVYGILNSEEAVKYNTNTELYESTSAAGFSSYGIEDGALITLNCVLYYYNGSPRLQGYYTSFYNPGYYTVDLNYSISGGSATVATMDGDTNEVHFGDTIVISEIAANPGYSLSSVTLNGEEVDLSGLADNSLTFTNDVYGAVTLVITFTLQDGYIEYTFNFDSAFYNSSDATTSQANFNLWTAEKVHISLDYGIQFEINKASSSTDANASAMYSYCNSSSYYLSIRDGQSFTVSSVENYDIFAVSFTNNSSTPSTTFGYTSSGGLSVTSLTNLVDQDGTSLDYDVGVINLTDSITSFTADIGNRTNISTMTLLLKENDKAVYDVSNNDGVEGGTVAAYPMKAVEGTDINIIVTLNLEEETCYLEKLEVNGSELSNPSYSAGTYTFVTTMVENGIYIMPTFTESPASTSNDYEDGVYYTYYYDYYGNVVNKVVDESYLSFAGGTNTEEDPLVIATADQFESISNLSAGTYYFKLDSDDPIEIDVSDEAVTVNEGVTVYLDLNGVTITEVEDCKTSTSSAAANVHYMVKVYGTLEIDDNTATDENPAGDGMLAAGDGIIYVYASGSLTLNAGTYTSYRTYGSGLGVYILSDGDNYSTINYAEIYASCMALCTKNTTVYDGIFVSISNYARGTAYGYGYAVWASSNSTFYGGEVYGIHGGVAVAGANVSMYDDFSVYLGYAKAIELYMNVMVETGQDQEANFLFVYDDTSGETYIDDKFNLATVTISHCFYTIYLGDSSAATLTIYGGYYESAHSSRTVIRASSFTSVSIEGGTFTSASSSNAILYFASTTGVTITGGSFYLTSGCFTALQSVVDTDSYDINEQDSFYVVALKSA